MADARAAVEAVTSSFGGLDVLVNCVGIFDFYRGLADLADDQLDAAFDEMFAVNVKSQLVTVRAALPELRRAGGSVVLTVSTSGFYPGRGGVLYVASKFAVRGCVIALAHELAPEVRVNGVAPGGTLGTELTGPRQPRPGRPGPGRGPGPRGGPAPPHPAARRARRRGPRGQLRVPGLGPRPRHHRHRSPLRRRHRHQMRWPPIRHIRGALNRHSVRERLRFMAFGPIPGGAESGAGGDPGGDQVGGLGPRAVGLCR